MPWGGVHVARSPSLPASPPLRLWARCCRRHLPLVHVTCSCHLSPHLPNSCSTLSPHPCGKRVLSPQKVQAGHRGLSPTAQMWGLSLTAQGPQVRTWWLDRQVTAQVNCSSERKGSRQGSSVSVKGNRLS